MCGFSAAQAHGRNPRLTQGSKSDPAAMRDISSALQEERACKALMLNYRSGLPDQPFWNMLSINPVRHAVMHTRHLSQCTPVGAQGRPVFLHACFRRVERCV